MNNCPCDNLLHLTVLVLHGKRLLRKVGFDERKFYLNSIVIFLQTKLLPETIKSNKNEIKIFSALSVPTVILGGAGR